MSIFGIIVFTREVIGVKVFVYGSLLTGLGNHGVVKQFINKKKRGTVNGKLYSLGAFPALKEGDDEVHGELYYIDEDNQEIALDKLDYLEGHPFLYTRKKTEVETKDGTEKAWTYFYNGDISDK